MENKNLTVRFVALFVLVGVCASLVLFRDFNLGIDLRGGYSLVYKCQMDENSPSDLSTRMINVLKDRVDPHGLLSLEWTPQGPDRFEVRMRAAGEKTVEAKAKYQGAVRTLLEKNINWGDIVQIQAAAVGAQPQAASAPATGPAARPLPKACTDLIAQKSAGDEKFAAALDEMARLYRTLTEARKAAQEATDPKARQAAERLAVNTEQEFLEHTRLVQDMVTARQVLPTVLQTALANFVTTQERNSLIKSVEGRKELERRAKEFTRQLDDLKASHKDRAGEIDEVAELYKTWMGKRQELDDPADLKRLLTKVGVLEFRIAPYHPQSGFALKNPSSELVVPAKELEDYVKLLRTESLDQLVKRKDRFAWFPMLKNERVGQGLVVMQGPKDLQYVLLCNTPGQTILRGSGAGKWALDSARRSSDELGRACVAFNMDGAGERKMRDLTGQYNKSKIEPDGAHMAILLDDEVYSAPTIRETIGGSGQITGTFTDKEVDDLVRTLTAGSLPAKLIPEPVAENSFGPTLGKVNRDAGIRASIWGLVAVVVFMFVYYLLPGSLADIAVVLNLVLTMGFMIALNVTLTMAGIAGLILTMGMAVDANVLIYERLREEQAKGLPIRMAIKNSYERAFSAIFDSNLTTLITCVILGWIGSVEVRGFAITLGLGLVFSMFTALVVTRWMFEAMLRLNWIRKPMRMMKLIGVPNIDWISKRYIFWGISLVTFIVGMVALGIEGRDVLGIEFSSGSRAIIQFRDDALIDGKPLSDEVVRARFETAAKGLKHTLLAATARVEERPAENRMAELLAGYDGKGKKDKDGKVDRAEWIDGGSSEKAFDLYDKNRNGVLDPAEVKEMPSTQYQVTTTEPRAETVRTTAREAFKEALVQQQASDFAPAGMGAKVMDLTLNRTLRVTDEVLKMADVDWGWVDITPEVARGNVDPLVRKHAGGIVLSVQNVRPAMTAADLVARIRTIRQQPDMTAIAANQFDVQPLTADPDFRGRYTAFAVLVTSGGKMLEKEKDIADFAAAEATGLTVALKRPEAVPITTFDPALAGEAVQRAIVAIVLSWFGIVAYLWLRFGSWRWGLGAVFSLVHDSIVTVGMVALTGWLSTTFIGHLLGVDDPLKIDMVMVAAILTLIGYSVNDTIVVFDRIRENRGKLSAVNANLINVSINQTLPRTLLTGVSTLAVVLIMYITGGSSIHGFNYALLLGILFGTYSSIAVASPILLGFKKLFARNLTAQDQSHTELK